INLDEILVALQSGLHRFNLSTHTLQLIHDPEPDVPATRLNDGKTDRAGQFLFASMGVTDRTQGWGGLYRLRRDGVVERLLDNVIVGNGPCFSPNGDILYFSDGRGVILQFDYDPDRGLSAPRPFFDAKAAGTACDGATVDAAGNLWVALIGSGKIGCISPMGELKLTIDLPIPLPSSVIFGDPGLDSLYVTSISYSGNREDSDPQSGLVFKITGLGAAGLPEMSFNEFSS
ncbi:SMP-30/gluconolactonase/LRE family protein, partial [Pseudomonadales bacterium]|nr:SMP-30/gluconolactonase/LRE family protein [Pseudomonadales bacterium]